MINRFRPLMRMGLARMRTPASMFMQVAPFVTRPGSSDPDFQPEVKTQDEKVYEEVKAKITELVKSNPVVIFMKGSPENPQCGFSRAVVKILAAEEVDDYIYADVLKNPAIREGVKKYSDWPTIPQVYIKGEFIGGCDIVTDMHKSGELKKLLKESGIVE